MTARRWGICAGMLVILIAALVIGACVNTQAESPRQAWVTEEVTYGGNIVGRLVTVKDRCYFVPANGGIELVGPNGGC